MEDERFEALKNQLLNCRLCAATMSEEPRPVFQGRRHSRILQISQAPSRKVMETGLPFNDASWRKLKQEWYQITDNQFYNPELFYIASIARCYPGKAKGSGDNPPPRRCAELYLRHELELVEPRLMIVIGSYAAQWLFPDVPLETLVFEDRMLKGIPVRVLPHPSPLNRKWLKDHPEFEADRLPEIRRQVKAAIFENADEVPETGGQ